MVTVIIPVKQMFSEVCETVIGECV